MKNWINWIQDDFFRITIGEYVLPNIENLLFVTGCEKGKCASPLGLYVCKCMEFWGYLIAEDEHPFNGEAAKKIMDYLALTLGAEEATSLRAAIELDDVPYALLAAGGIGLTVIESHPLFENRTLNTKKLAQVFVRSLDKLHERLGDEAIVARVVRRLKVLVQKEVKEG